jgi:serine/threonine protein phosphatase 1
MKDTTYYAIGDVHGMADKLAALHRAIVQRIAGADGPSGIVHLGDYVDRGPDSRRVIDLILALMVSPPGGAVVRALRGNHEQLMLDAIDAPKDEADWFLNGGNATLTSYGVSGVDENWRDAIDPDHVAWLRALPCLVRDEERRLAFVHAGIEPAKFPECGDETHLWTRSRRFFDTASWPRRDELGGLLVVHGHTPTDDYAPFANSRRINVDTGAVYGGPLSCVVLAPGAPPEFLFA